jgi:hypothetical protein
VASGEHRDENGEQEKGEMAHGFPFFSCAAPRVGRAARGEKP